MSSIRTARLWRVAIRSQSIRNGGSYDFPAIKRDLADYGFEVIAWHRPQKTDPALHAKALVEQVSKLLDAGVEPNRITLLGFSRGGYISALASSGEIDDAINVILLAACGKWVKNSPDIRLHGNFLSIYETSDSVGSCKKLAGNSPELVSFEEISISTGLSHGAFYRPIEPVDDASQRLDTSQSQLSSINRQDLDTGLFRPAMPSRYSAGEWPVCFLKACEKWLRLENPTRLPICSIG